MTVPAQSPNPRVESDQGAGVIAPETASEVAGPGASVLGSHDGVEQDEAALNGVDDLKFVFGFGYGFRYGFGSTNARWDRRCG
jgi:hypothetical protein